MRGAQLMHGLEDNTIEATSSEMIFKSASCPKAAIWLRNADHTMSARFDVVLSMLQSWLPGSLLLRLLHRLPRLCHCPDQGLKAASAVLHL